MRLLLPALLVGCEPFGPWPGASEDSGALQGGRIVVSPARIDFGRVSVTGDGAATGTLTLYNLGDAPETVTGHDEVLGCADFTVAADPILELGPGAELDLLVTFAPRTEETCVAELLVQPAEEVVRLEGLGAAPVLDADDATFDPVVLGCVGTGIVTVRNAGSEPLALASAEVHSDEFAVGVLPGELAPGASGEIAVTFTPAGGGNRGTTLLLESNDPAAPSAAVALSGLGYEGERVTETFRYRPTNPTDVLFVVDTGGVVGARAGQADSAIEAYVDLLRETNVDYQVAALSGASTCPPSTPFATRSDTSIVAERVLDHGLRGDPGDWDNDLLGLALAALEETGAGACLEGFRREDADLQVVVVTDSPSAENPVVQAETLEAALGEDATLLIAGLLPLSDCGEPAEDYAQVAERWGGDVEDVCASDWTDAFLTFASLPEADEPVRFWLAEEPVVSSIEVRVEGTAWTDWSWDDGAVAFDGEDQPLLGAEVEVEYVSAVACQ